MKWNILSSAACAVLLVGSAAHAADMPVKARSVPVVVDAWTGVYVGANAGYAWGRSRTDANYFASNLVVPESPFLPAGSSFCADTSGVASLKGAFGGVQLGMNEQRGGFVYGIETDFQISGQKGDVATAAIFSTPFFIEPTFFGNLQAQESQKLRWFGTLRGRAGFAVGGLFIYGTGGLAYGQVSATGAAQITTRAEFQPEAALAPFIAWDTKSTKIGWTAGAGVEGRLSQHWSLKVEYLYLDLGSVDNTVVTPPTCVGAGPVCINVNPGAATFHRSVSDNIVRVGINFRP